MKHKAVVFDLFGTLVYDVVKPQMEEARAGMAGSLSIPVEEFNRIWAESSLERNSGGFASMTDNITYICQKLGLNKAEADIEAAAKIRRNLDLKKMMSPRKGVLETLSGLRELGLKIGLISNCTPDPEIIWPATPFSPLFDTAVFSPSAGCMKPDHRIYKIAADRLGVDLEACVYVANGNSGELKGAFDAGMFPVLILPTEDEKPFIIYPSEEEIALAQDKGRVIYALTELLDLLDEV